jgi:hypothetical protein
MICSATVHRETRLSLFLLLEIWMRLCSLRRRLDELIPESVKPVEKRNTSLFNLSKQGLLDAATAVAAVIPAALPVAQSIFDFLSGK